MCPRFLVLALAASSCVGVSSSNALFIQRSELVRTSGEEAKLSDDVLVFALTVSAGSAMRLDSSLTRGLALRLNELRDCKTEEEISIFVPLFLKSVTATSLEIPKGMNLTFRVRYPVDAPPGVHLPDCVRGSLRLVPEDAAAWAPVLFEARRERQPVTDL
jgi:hypothetical protein